MNFKDSDFKIQWFSGTGSGGQHRNKTQNCCRVLHIATRIHAVGQRERTREGNLKQAMTVCRERVEAFFEKPEERFKATEERVRTYHEPDNRVTDHLSELSLSYKEVVRDGDISRMIESRKKASLSVE